MKQKIMRWIASPLLILGGLNWLFLTWFSWNIVTAVFGNWVWVVKLVNTLMGVAALFAIYLLAVDE